MSENSKLDFSLETSNIGPLADFSFSGKIGSCKIGIFANNGSGKTFLSRMFRLVETPDLELEKINNLLSIESSKGDFKFALKSPQEGGRIRNLEINVKRDDQNVSITNNTGYLFHTFNTDYVRENIEEREYAADGTVEGYILGKGNIDITKEQAELADLVTKRDNLKTELEEEIETEKAKLDGLAINKNLANYKFFNYENLSTKAEVEESQTFSNLKELHNALKALPDDLPDIPNFSDPSLVTDFEKIKTLLTTSYSRSSLAEEFVNKIKRKQLLIEEGLKANNDKECPFCEQAYSNEASELIRKYNSYLEDEEAKVVKRCSSLIQRLMQDKKSIETAVSSALKASNDFNKNKKYIPSLQEDVFLDYNLIESLSAPVEEICLSISEKAHNIDKIDFSISVPQKLIDSYNASLSKTNALNLKKVATFNSKKNNTQSEKRELDRRLCSSLFIETGKALSAKFEDLSKVDLSIQELDKSIKEKEAQVRIEKKQKVADSLIQFLDLFFAGKYSFDNQHFSITFKGKLLNQKIAAVLSDGEKSIVAFCHYLAETHVLLSTDDDYKKLFFIIDDPISSLDFHYVYAVSQVIRNIETYFNLKGHTRFIVLTHNIEFMSILCRNKIVQQRYVLSSGKIGPLSEHLIMPYESHLKDIHAVAREGAQATHTTANSIRHVLETICRFDAPKANLEDYFNDIQELKGNEFVYSLMHDGSHGMLRTNKPFTEGMIQRGCEAVIQFIDKKFEGQVEHIATN